jgi:hypothetical protein
MRYVVFRGERIRSRFTPLNYLLYNEIAVRSQDLPSEIVTLSRRELQLTVADTECSEFLGLLR